MNTLDDKLANAEDVGQKRDRRRRHGLVHNPPQPVH